MSSDAGYCRLGLGAAFRRDFGKRAQREAGPASVEGAASLRSRAGLQSAETTADRI
jgi:hypothetical protein